MVRLTGHKRGAYTPKYPKIVLFLHFSPCFTWVLTVFDPLNVPGTSLFVSITLYPGDQKSQCKYGKINCPLFVDAPLFSVFCVF